MSSKYPPLFPKPPQATPPPQAQEETPPQEPSGRRRRPNVSAACIPCRQRKVKCDGLRETCGPCAKTNRECSYAGGTSKIQNQELQTRNQQLETDLQNLVTIYGTLQQTSQEVAFELFQQIRQGVVPQEALASINPSPSQTHPSTMATNRIMLPWTDSPLEFQLVALHSNAYPTSKPLDVASLDLKLLGMTPFASFGRWKRSTPPNSTPDGHQEQQATAMSVDGESSQTNISHDLVGIYVDDRLGRINIRRWTHVDVTDDFAAQALSLYLMSNTGRWACFDIDLFLDDMVNGAPRFCSRLLVNALLAWACQSYAYHEPRAAAFSSEFLAEASLLYEVEKDIDTLTTVAATSLMFMTWALSGKDKVWRKLLVDNASMANRLQLYGVPPDASTKPLDVEDDDVRAAAAATAWGSFTFQMMVSMTYRTEPLAKLPPTLPIPGDLGTSDSTGRQLPLYQGSTFTFVCKFWLIAYEMNYQYFYRGTVSLAVAETIYQKLLTWADNLPEHMRRRENNTDHVLNLHIWFHTVVIDIFRPFVDPKAQTKLPSFSGADATPKTVVDASIKQLKRLIYDYRSRCQSANYNIVWQSGMLYLVDHILHNSMNNEAHFYFLLCMRGYQNLARTLPVVVGIVQGIAVLAVQLGVILPEEAWKLFDEIKVQNRTIRDYLSTYPVNLHGFSKDAEAASLESLVKEFDAMVVGESKEPESPDAWRNASVGLYTTLLHEDEDTSLQF